MGKQCCKDSMNNSSEVNLMTLKEREKQSKRNCGCCGGGDDENELVLKGINTVKKAKGVVMARQFVKETSEFYFLQPIMHNYLKTQITDTLVHLNEFTYNLENYTDNGDDEVNSNEYDDILESLQSDLQKYRQEDRHKAKKYLEGISVVSWNKYIMLFEKSKSSHAFFVLTAPNEHDLFKDEDDSLLDMTMQSVRGELYSERYDTCRKFFEEKIKNTYTGIMTSWHIVLTGWSLGGTLAEVLTIQHLGLIDHCESFNAVNDKPDVPGQKKSTFEINVENIYEKLLDQNKKPENRAEIKKNKWDAQEKIFSHHIQGDTLSEGKNLYQNQTKDNINFCYEKEKEARTKFVLHSDQNFIELVGAEEEQREKEGRERQAIEKEKKRKLQEKEMQLEIQKCPYKNKCFQTDPCLITELKPHELELLEREQNSEKPPEVTLTVQNEWETSSVIERKRQVEEQMKKVAQDKEALKQKAQEMQKQHKSFNEGAGTLAHPIVSKGFGYKKTKITDILAHLCQMTSFTSDYSDDEINTVDMKEQMVEELKIHREDNHNFFNQIMKKIEYVTMSNGVFLFVDKDNMYFVVLKNYLNYHRNHEDDHNKDHNSTPLHRIQNTQTFIKAELNKRTTMFGEFPVFCTGHSLGGLFAEILTLSTPEIQQCESFNSMGEQFFKVEGFKEGEYLYDEAIINEMKAIKELYGTECKKKDEKAQYEIQKQCIVAHRIEKDKQSARSKFGQFFDNVQLDSNEEEVYSHGMHNFLVYAVIPENDN